MGGRFHFTDDNSQRAKAVLLASKRMKPMNSKARAAGSDALQGCDKVVSGKPFKGTHKESMRLQCPHCEHPCVIRTSEQMSKLTRQSVYCCVNPECGHTFVANTEIVRTLSPSATPDPSVVLPLSSHVRRDMLRVQLDHAATAAHTTRSTAPVTGDLFTQGIPPPD